MKKSSSYLYIISGIGLMLILLTSDSIAAKLIFTLAASVLATLSGKRIKPLYFIIFIAGISFFELLIPRGRVLASLGSLSITEDALATGLKKGLTLAGLVFLSLYAVKKDMPLPGRAGRYFAMVFEYYAALMSNKKKIDRNNIISSLDDILWQSMDISTHKKNTQERDINPVIGLTLLAAEIIISIAARLYNIP